jgi:hypothetical protein
MQPSRSETLLRSTATTLRKIGAVGDDAVVGGRQRNALGLNFAEEVRTLFAD